MTHKRKIIPTDFSTPEKVHMTTSLIKEANVHYDAEIKKRSKDKGKIFEKCIFASRNSRLRSLRLSFSLGTYTRVQKLHDFSYQSGNITKRMEFMHPRVRITSAFEWEKSAEVISPLSRVRQTPSAFPSWHESFSFPFPLLLLFAYLFHPPFSHSSSRSFCSSLVNLSFAGSRLEADGKAGK